MSATNRLSQETSPYLLQHANNPVHWYPWGEDALTRAKADNRPILLSIGYAACHWCHVMERESFENEEIAALMNEHFVCIKVDREERPDVDDIYMSAVQMMTGSGGWPLTVFLTPELEPFFGGTYFPPEDRYGRPGFATVLTEIARLVEEEPSRVFDSAKMLTEQIRSLAKIPTSGELLSRTSVSDAVRELAARFDSNHGGFGAAPKFPPAAQLSLLLLHHFQTRDPDALEIVERTLAKMSEGGIYDHLGGGFHRYSTDARWLVPHFEKMLYDNALLSRAYLEAYQVTGNNDYARVSRECLDWVLRDMQDEAGGYFSTLDADSEGVEGKFYVWSLEEIQSLLGAEDAALFAKVYDVSAQGNWEGSNILNRAGALEAVASELDLDLDLLSRRLDAMKKTLLDVRAERIWPGLDDKVLTSWNALMILSMSRGARILAEPRYYESAVRASRFLLDTMVKDGRLLATYRAGSAKLKAYLDDYAFLIAALIELYETDFNPQWIDEACRLARSLEELFWDESGGGFFFTGRDHEPLIARTKSGYDGAIPSGNAVAALYLQRLARLSGDESFQTLAEKTIRAYQAQFERSPSGFPSLLLALDFYLSDTNELVSVGQRGSESFDGALENLAKVYAPRTVFAVNDLGVEATSSEKWPLLAGKSGSTDGEPRFYLCRNYTCQAPTQKLDELIEQLKTGSAV